MKSLFGMALAYASRDSSVSAVFSIAGTDHGQFIRKYQIDDTLLRLYRAMRSSGARDASFLTFHSDHTFHNVLSQIHENLLTWILK